MKQKALRYLRQAIGREDVDFRDGQWESIEALMNRERQLVVQRTGWGKSMVYFLATRLLRDEGTGPTLLISPLLSLMRNQLEAATKIGVRAETINSTNPEDWGSIEAKLKAGKIDLLLISPERLANDKFRENVLSHIASQVGLFVVDEAHCISDWGHDFRPDYRRILRVIQVLPSNIPVLATTATANDRVVADIAEQLGSETKVVRGPLTRKSLKLQNIKMPSPTARMAWLAETIPTLEGSGIIYALTVRDANRVASWLQQAGIDAVAYSADSDDREGLERGLLENKLKVLVATVALGMGFDKPDLGFVIHYQRPGSVVHYYQQVGRAGRAVDEAFGILLHGEEDEEITNFFIKNAFPPQNHVQDILHVIKESENGLSVPQLQNRLNLRDGRIKAAIKYLSVESPAPIIKINSKWSLSAAGEKYAINQQLVDGITAIRVGEQKQMADYMEHPDCLMEFLGLALDDPTARPCGQCASCKGAPLLPIDYSEETANQAAIFLRRNHQGIKVRKQWPAGDALATYGFKGKMKGKLNAQDGRALSLWRDAGWGELVAKGKYETEHFDDRLIEACVEMIEGWELENPPTWLTCIPSLHRPDLVPDFAARLAIALKIPFIACISKVKQNQPQKKMENSFMQASNLDGVFQVDLEKIQLEPCFLLDDVIDSGWTFTVAAGLLRQAGCESVSLIALAQNSPRQD